ncbi:hypothetical protein BL254_13065 [Protofrankia sp. BMG5.30]|uniref:Uncharacterized protein n=2 Tax=Frankiaceae TaxID=74712 RepID=A0ABR5F1V0_9ACTN|nr:hypothetical protein FrCorBMG51_16575 [Protofrankia coriariae]ONH35157.1 hypothetical protein BL254_13065 [Protofrankia sp. BMG5.30]
MPAQAGGPAAGRPRVLLAPVTVTPTKPLTPSHLKFLLWIDVMYRATVPLADVILRCSHTTYHQTEQTLGFWEYLDRTRGDDDYAAMSEVDVGELYVAYRADGRRPTAEALRPYADAAEHGWVHPASVRVLRAWQTQYRILGMHDPGLLAHVPPGADLATVLDRLAELGVLVDLRAHGGPVHLDLTRFGQPLRQIIAADGRPNYLACALRELLPLAGDHDEIVLAHDPELDADYRLLSHVLEMAGATVRRYTIGRVPIDGVLSSARQGDWRGHDAATLLASLSTDHTPDAVRLGFRLYFIAVLGPGPEQSLREDLLRHCVARAERLCENSGGPAPGHGVEPAGPPGRSELIELLEQHRGRHLYIDPYRLTSHAFGRRRPAPARQLLSEAYL